MPLLRKGVLLPVKGADFSQPATFIDPRAGFPQNMRYFKNEMRKRPGKTEVGSALSSASQVMGIGVLDLSTGVRHLIRGSKTELERYNTSTEAWVSIAATALTGDDEDFLHFATVSESDIIAMTNGVDVIRKWTGSGNVATLGGAPPLAKYVCYLSPYLILAHVTESGDVKPWKVRWSDTSDPEVWSGGNSGSALLSSEPSAIQNILKLNEIVAVYKKESLGIGYKVENNDIFQFDTIKTGIGLISPRAAVDAIGQHYFMGFSDFYVWNGARVTSIGAPVREHVFSRINRDNQSRCFSIHVQEQNEVWFFVVLSGNSWPTEVWKYNYGNGFWYYDTCSSLTAAIKWEKIATESWDDDTGSWDSASDVWDSGTSVQAWEEIVFGSSVGQTMSLDYNTADDLGVAVSGILTTKDFTGDVLEFNKRWLQIDVWARGTDGGKLYIDYSEDEGSTWTNIPYTSSQAYISLTGVKTKYEMYFDIVSDKIRFRFRNAESEELFTITNFYPYYLSREQIQPRRS